MTASRIARARIVALDGVDHWPFIGDVDAVVARSLTPVAVSGTPTVRASFR